MIGFLIKQLTVLTALAGPLDGGLATLQLDGMLRDLATVRAGVHFQDEGRVFVLEQVVLKLRDSVREKGLSHAQTTHLYHQVIIRFKYSDRFFQFIRTRRNGRALDSLAAAILAIRRETGFDDDPYSQVLRASLEQLYQSIEALLRLNDVPAELTTRLRALIPKLGAALAAARQGDRPIAFEKAAGIHRDLRSFYPLLHGVSARSPGFELVLEILGVSEFISEYAQVDRPS